MKGTSIGGRVRGAYSRRMAKWFGQRRFVFRTAQPVISFTFDDFPESALTVAGDILEAAGVRGTYFVSRGLMGQKTATGNMFREDHLPLLVSRGHELGCHTFHHYPAWDTAPATYESSTAENALALAALMRGIPPQTHSYPISYPRPATKRRLAKRFRGCRGGGQTYNHGSVDANYLSSFFLEQSRDDFAAIERIIARNADAGGWLIFSTHDVGPSPTRFGCTAEFFARVVQASVRSGASILGVAKALDTIGAPPWPDCHRDPVSAV